MKRPFVEIDGIVINQEVLDTRFACDLNQCKGACCTLDSEYGAPLLIEEIPLMEKYLPVVLEYLPELHKAKIAEAGFHEYKEGEMMTQSLNNRACVFVFYETGIAKCAYERAYFEGKIDFRKPISCHLFPIRVTDFLGEVIRYERFQDCAPALENGKKENITIAEFCKDSLIRKYGQEWHQKLLLMVKK